MGLDLFGRVVGASESEAGAREVLPPAPNSLTTTDYPGLEPGQRLATCDLILLELVLLFQVLTQVVALKTWCQTKMNVGSCGVAVASSAQTPMAEGSNPARCHRSCALGKGTLHDFPHFTQPAKETGGDYTNKPHRDVIDNTVGQHAGGVTCSFPQEQHT
ncbi:hypothetical protein Bbelb_105510 [Branchiostoma belcheri]|nr:hypothetical protein Bbelb_105510 [Branchiostoma belcheri]